MQMVLTQCQAMEKVEENPPLLCDSNEMILRVSYCAICRTDAKMWSEGHRDLVLPRVLGHEFVGRGLDDNNLYIAWPGGVCNTCRYCIEGRENLCETMRIQGFHSDGGFSNYVTVGLDSLILVSENIEEKLLTFAEPMACVLNAFEKIQPQANQSLLIYGGGVVGMLAALAARHKGCRVTVIEQSAEKISRLTDVCNQNNIKICKDTVAADFDLALNCCDSPIAFSLSVTKLRKGGKLGFFSGLKKRQELETTLINLIHYKELELYGSYGPRRVHMKQAVKVLSACQKSLPMLLEKIITPDEILTALPHVLSGEALKYIVDFTAEVKGNTTLAVPNQDKSTQNPTKTDTSPFIQNLIAAIHPVNRDLQPAAQRKVDMKTKPLGALGKIEQLAVQLSVIQKTLTPEVTSRRLFVFAGDHGVVEEGVSAFPAKVTVQMVENFLTGGAAINVFCRHYGIDLNVVDMGVNGKLASHSLMIDKKVAHGTANFAIQPAMTRKQALTAIQNGATAFLEKHAEKPCQLVGMGEMGIGNTSSATAIICAATGLDVATVVGRGTGVDDKGLERKREVLEKALHLHQPKADDGLDLLIKVGGYELAGICGAVLAAAASGCCVVLDGIISTAAGLLAYLLCPSVQGYLVAGHKSVETGQQAALELMGLSPVLDLDFRLGEGTGAAITMNLVDLSCQMMREMASFDEAGVDSGDI